MSEERVREEAEPGEESANDDSNDAEETASSIKQADALRDEAAEVYRQADELRREAAKWPTWQEASRFYREQTIKRYQDSKRRYQNAHANCGLLKLGEAGILHPFIRRYDKYVKSVDKRFDENPDEVPTGQLSKAAKKYGKLLYLGLDRESDKSTKCWKVIALALILFAIAVLFLFSLPWPKSFPLSLNCIYELAKQFLIDLPFRPRTSFLLLAAVVADVVSIRRYRESARNLELEKHTEDEQKIIKSSEYRRKVNSRGTYIEAVGIMLASGVALLAI